MQDTELQKQLFAHIKRSLPPNISMADALAELLGLSYDSIYRRIRGEKPITLDELQILCSHYNLSLDQLLQLKSSTVVFNASGLDGPVMDIEEYLRGVLQQMKFFNSFEKRQMLYQCKDAPVFYFYLFPEIGAFKTFCWIKTILAHPDYNQKIFSLKEFPFKECFDLGQQILKEYNLLPGTELWISESLNSTINQLRYYRDAKLFRNMEDFDLVLASLDKVIDHLSAQAEKGVKFMPGAGETGYKAQLNFYVNEVLLGNNTILAELNGEKTTIITYNALSYLMTKDIRFCTRSFENFHTLVSRSTLVSGTGEKDRNKFFQELRGRVNELRNSH